MINAFIQEFETSLFAIHEEIFDCLKKENFTWEVNMFLVIGKLDIIEIRNNIEQQSIFIKKKIFSDILHSWRKDLYDK